MTLKGGHRLTIRLDHPFWEPPISANGDFNLSSGGHNIESVCVITQTSDTWIKVHPFILYRQHTSGSCAILPVKGLLPLQPHQLMIATQNTQCTLWFVFVFILTLQGEQVKHVSYSPQGLVRWKTHRKVCIPRAPGFNKSVAIGACSEPLRPAPNDFTLSLCEWQIAIILQMQLSSALSFFLGGGGSIYTSSSKSHDTTYMFIACNSTCINTGQS